MGSWVNWAEEARLLNEVCKNLGGGSAASALRLLTRLVWKAAVASRRAAE